jgi:mono/diheme cytochrome c family protein
LRSLELTLTCAMRWLGTSLMTATLLLFPNPALHSAATSDSAGSALVLPLQSARLSSLDLEIGGELSGVPPGTTRYISRAALLTLPQATYRVSNDPNFTGSTQVSGVLLEDLFRSLGAAAYSDLIVAICRDQYNGSYPRDYIAAHHPLLVLAINGKPPAEWPRNAEVPGGDMGPYMISHPTFSPRFKVLAHSDEPQIPWGVVRLEFRNEKTVFGAIAPRGSHAAEPTVQNGYRIAQQNCFRCHNMGREGGHKASRPWPVLSAMASAAPDYFAAYVRNPRASNRDAQMPANPTYDDATIHALVAYFASFSSEKEKQEDKP